jgi:hypothetical protein
MAADGLEALQTFRSDRPDLVVTSTGIHDVAAR